MSVLYAAWMTLANMLIATGIDQTQFVEELAANDIGTEATSSASMICNCSITQGAATYPISALIGNETASSFYDYGNPSGSSANTGLELNNGLIIFLYEDLNTGIISLFLITDIVNSGTGGSMEFEISCLPLTSSIVVMDDPGEFSGSPPLITGSWDWTSCCTDGGVVENVGCNTTFSVDLLISSGIDSIVWLSGNIAAPDHLLMSMNGDIITVNCGAGSICCPVGFDTDIVVTDATCMDTPNGVVDLTPHDGMPPYDFDWSNGASSEDLSMVLPGSYIVTITDSQGCSEVLNMTVGVSPGTPGAAPAEIELCSENPIGIFDLTTVNDLVNLGTGFDVIWFVNANMTGEITNPASYSSGTGTVYAVVDNGSCLSIPVPVDLEIIISPMGTATTMNACEDENGMATFDLTSLDPIVSGGGGVVIWYLNSGLTIEIPDPSAFLSSSATIYAIVNDGNCSSDPVEIELIVDLQPLGNMAALSMCGDAFDDAIFDLTLLDLEISDGNGSVEWFTDIDLADEISNPTEFLSPSVTVYAAVFDGICYSDPIPVFLIVDHTPDANPVTAELCHDGSGLAVFNLWDYALLVSGGVGGVDWFFDIALQDQIPNPEAFLTGTVTIYAAVDDGTCISDPAPIQLNVQATILGNPTSLEVCADSTGQGTFDLNTANNTISGGTGTVSWFEDFQGLFPVSTPSMFVSAGTTVYAQVSDGACVSEFIPIVLTIVSSVSATPAQAAACEGGAGMAIFNLTTIENVISGGSGQVNWFLDPSGIVVIISPDIFLSGDSVVYASVTAGSCVSDIVPIDLMVLTTPVASDVTLTLCGNANGEITFNLTTIDTLVSENMGIVSWYGDALLTMTIPAPTTFFTGDTTIYATVSNGACVSSSAVVIISVSPGLTANADTLELCIPANDTITTDLTQSDPVISSGSGQVNWFIDAAGNIPVITPSAFPVSVAVTVYANISSGNCISAVVPVQIEVFASPVASALDIQKCGDASGQITVDLNSYDTLVSNGTGNVTWYSDVTLMTEIINPGTFTSGDTVIYAIAQNGFCESAPASVTLNIVDSLTANSITVEECVMGSDDAIINLTLSEVSISGGSGTVYWFTDILGADTIPDPTAFTTSGDVIFANFTADGCTSNIATITIEVASSDLPLPACAFTSIDSISISWPDLGTDYQYSYTLNGQPIGSPVITPLTGFHLGGLDQGDEIVFSVTALFDDPCAPLTNSITCITEICASQTLEFVGLQPEYCSDEGIILITTIPPGGLLSGEGIVGTTLDPALVVGGSTEIFYTWEDIASGCVYDISASVQFFDALSSPVLTCGLATINSVRFDWNDVASEFGYEYVINQGTGSGTILTGISSLLIENLNQGDEVTLNVWSIGVQPCGNSDTVSITCFAKQCPSATIRIESPGIICENDDTLQMHLTIGLLNNPTITWSGQGIIDPSGIFDPSLVSSGETILTVTVEEGGCIYMASENIHLIALEIAEFEISGTACLDSILDVNFTGMAFLSSQWNWDFDGAELISGVPPMDFSLQWSEPGNYVLGLVIDRLGCVSEPFNLPVQIDAPLDTPVITCVEEDYFSLMIGWEPVAGASSYIVTSSIGTGILSGNTYSVRNLPDDTMVNITVTAIGPSACGPTSSMIECHTIPFIPINSFIPNIFSPNGDGINDILFIQSNSEVTSVSVFRVFDRWGDVIFEDFDFMPNDPAHGWDGTYAGKEMNPGVFVYWAKLQTTRGELVVVGDVMVMR